MPILLNSSSEFCLAPGKTSQVRALIDPCAEASFITESLTQRLRLQRSAGNFSVTAVADMSTRVRGTAQFSIRSCINNDCIYNSEALVLNNVSSYVPKYSSFDPAWTHLSNIELADPRFFTDDEIELNLLNT